MPIDHAISYPSIMPGALKEIKVKLIVSSAEQFFRNGLSTTVSHP
jgi:hypothetical protein